MEFLRPHWVLDQPPLNHNLLVNKPRMTLLRRMLRELMWAKATSRAFTID